MSGSPSGAHGPLLRRRLMIVVVLVGAAASLGHVNSPHIYLEEQIGPYPAIVIIHMPPAVPGEAEVQVRLQDRAPGDEVRILVREIPPQGEKRAPEWTVAQGSKIDPDFYTAPLPLMLYGLWHAEVKLEGSRGEGTTKIPVPARVPVPRAMNVWISGTLILLILLLFVSFWKLLRRLGSDAHRPEAQPAPESARRRGLIWAVTGVVGLTGFVFFTSYNWYMFNAVRAVRAGSGIKSEITVKNPPAVAGKELLLELNVRDRKGRPINEVAPDHEKMMHMAVLRLPDASFFQHTHPPMTGTGRFELKFTPPEPGTYKTFADILFTSGEGETVTNTLEVGPGTEAEAIALNDPDDSYSFPPPIGDPGAGARAFDVGDGLVIRWLEPEGASLRKGEFMKLRFQLEDARGRPVDEIEPYMGMAGHLMIVRDDAQVFAHVHPVGTLPGRMSMPMDMDDMEMPEMESGMSMSMMHSISLPPEASFPFGFPDKGFYRMFAQMKHRGRVYTGVFDVRVR